MKWNGGKRWQTMVNNGTPVEEPTVQQQTKLQTNLASLIITLPTIFWVKCHGQWLVNISELFFFLTPPMVPKAYQRTACQPSKFLPQLPCRRWIRLNNSNCRGCCCWVTDVGDDFDGSSPGLILQQCTLTKESGLEKFSGRHEFGVKLGQFPEIIKRRKDAKGML